MAKVDQYEVPDELYYTTDHAWIKVEGNQIRIGVTDFMQQLAGDISFIRVPRVDKELPEGKTLASLQSGKWAGKLLVPMTGKVVDANKDLVKDPSPINKDPYGQGWIAVMEPDNLEEGLAALMQGEAVASWLLKEIAEHAK